MKKLVLTLPVVALLLSACSAQSTTTTLVPTTQSFVEPDFHFSFAYPQGWHSVECRNDQRGKVKPDQINVYLGMGQAIDCYSDIRELKNYFAQINFLAKVEQTDDFFATRVKGWLPMLEAPVTTKITVAGHQATQITGNVGAAYVSSNTATDAPAVIIELPYNGGLFTFLYYQDYQDHMAEFEQIVKSFKLPQ